MATVVSQDARKESKKEKEPSDGPGLQPRLNVIRGPNNIARVLRAPLVRLLDLVELHMNGTPLADGAEPEEGEPEEDDSFDVGSDKAPDIW